MPKPRTRLHGGVVEERRARVEAGAEATVDGARVRMRT